MSRTIGFKTARCSVPPTTPRDVRMYADWLHAAKKRDAERRASREREALEVRKSIPKWIDEGD
jgi:hypothetical protein